MIERKCLAMESSPSVRSPQMWQLDLATDVLRSPELDVAACEGSLVHPEVCLSRPQSFYAREAAMMTSSRSIPTESENPLEGGPAPPSLHIHQIQKDPCGPF